MGLTGACPVCPICPTVDDGPIGRASPGYPQRYVRFGPNVRYVRFCDRAACLEGERRSRAFWPARAACPECPECPICSDVSNYGCYVLIAPFVQACPLCSDVSVLSVMHQSHVRPDIGQRAARPKCPLWVDKYRDVRYGGVWAVRGNRHLWGYCPVSSRLPLSSRFLPYVRFDRGSAEVPGRGYPYLSPQIIPVTPHLPVTITSNYWYLLVRF